ncbi:MAG: UDP-N-acetylmuramate dehydrogenase [Acidobacteria bacterium]|nr:UDP-N-acetylmuramate dehydrogenase [Acidobacteriota bacterium]
MAPHWESGVKEFRAALSESMGEDRLFACEPLARYCNWKVGGPADLLFTARSTTELISVLRLAEAHALPCTVIGFGANSLVSDKGVRGLVVVNRAERIVFHPDSRIEVDSGSNLALLVRKSAEHGVGGLEFLIGIPGTVGAAIAGNAGTGGRWMGEVVERVQVYSRGRAIRELRASELEFGYRSTRLKRSPDVVISAMLRGEAASSSDVALRNDEMLQARRNQPPGPSAGSIFENPAGDFAGRLIEACGLKGRRVGGAEISGMHANFIVNRGGASASDIKTLIEMARAAVKDKFGIRLKEEICYLGDWT